MTTLRNPDGSLIFPAVVPPPVDFPFAPPNLPTAESADPELPTQDAAPEKTRKLSMSRPRVERTWQTERPQPSERVSHIHPLRLQGTNISSLNEATWNLPGSAEDPESSSEEESSATKVPVDAKISKPKKKHHFWSGKNHNQDDSNKGQFSVGNDEFSTRGRVRKDGRLNISINETKNRGYLAKALGVALMKTLPLENELQVNGHDTALPRAKTAQIPPPKLNIVVMVIGSRGDIQPFLKIGKVLKEEHGHRVRIATHPAFRDFVQKDSGLEFFSIGGDPAELMSFMVKNPGMIPKMETIVAGEVGRRRDQMAEMFRGFWRACINATDDEKDPVNMKMLGENKPFVADCIIANPVSFAHIHCAERLGIPLHLMFTFPYTPTQAFPHPLANIKRTNVDPGYTNLMSYPLIELMQWQGLGDLINTFRVECLGLEPANQLWAPGQVYRLKVPYTYLWSPGLIPKPSDWGPEIDIAGFVFLDLASSFKPPKALLKFLDAGEPPVYIGFGSIVVDDPDRFTKMIFEAVEMAGVRALVSKGWGGLGGDDVPENIFMLDNCPHDWLFPKVSAVVHHGGAGTCSIGLKCGKPTFIVPFFGDQQFWGSMVGKAGAGADPVPYKDLSAEKLAEGIKQCLTPEAKEGAEKIAKSIELEGDGAQNAVKSFHRSLVLRGEHSMRCCILEDRVAVWRMKNTNLRLSALAADILVEKKKVTWKQLRLIRHHEWNDFEGPGEPISGITTSVTSTLTGMASGVGSIPFRIAKRAKRQKHIQKKRQKSLAKVRKANDQTVNGNSETRKADTNHDLKYEEPNIPNGDSAAGEAGRTTKDANLADKTKNGRPILPNSNTNDNYEDGSGAGDDGNIAEEYAIDIGKGLGKSGEALARAPMDLALALAQGFHNAPRLYGDTTVRRPIRVTGIKSGFKAAGHEFVYGIYDGVTGVVKQPYHGAKEHGTVGFIKGVGMGLTGFILKDISAFVSPIAYGMKGVHRELLKNTGRDPTKFIRRARIAQGQRDLRDCRLRSLNENSEPSSKDSSPEPTKLFPLAKKPRRKTGVTAKTPEEQTVSHGWKVVLQVSQILEEKKHEQGSGWIPGSILEMKEKSRWMRNGAFENVEMAEKAVEATRRGESLEEVFRLQREEMEKAKEPRRGVLGS